MTDLIRKSFKTLPLESMGTTYHTQPNEANYVTALERPQKGSAMGSVKTQMSNIRTEQREVEGELWSRVK